MNDHYMENYNPEDEKFKKAFWEWFDNLPKKEKKKFQEYPSDMATIYFYNKIYKISPISPTG